MSKYVTNELDAIIHGKIRLGIMAYLSSVGSASFVDLREKIQSSDGNLSANLSKLEQAKYIKINKKFAGKKPLTIISLTKKGRNAWIEYLSKMQALLAGDK